MSQPSINRRDALKLGTGAALACLPALRLWAEDATRKFKIGVCDWSLPEGLQNVAAVEKARSLGIDGLQVSFCMPGTKYDLRQPASQRAYADACKKYNVEIASLGLIELNDKPYATDPNSEQCLLDCIEAMQQMGQKIVLVPFFGNGDIRDKPDAEKAVIARLKKAAPKAEKAGVILGFESWLNAEAHLRILDAVGSPAVQVYYDVANMDHCGYDVYAGIRQLGRDRICQIHAKENDFLLGKGKIDFVQVKAVLDDIQWNGWLIIESAVEPGKSLEESYKLNQQYLRSVFPT